MPLPKSAVDRIHAAITKIFVQAREMLLGADYGRPKGIRVTAVPKSLVELYGSAALAGGGEPAEETASVIRTIAEGYLDAQEASAKARVVQEVGAFVQDAAAGSQKELATALGGKLAETWGQVTAGVRRIVESESTVARNLGALEGIAAINEQAGVKDPVIYFVVVRDNSLCPECRRLHLLSDGVTPRCWLRSEVVSGYHRHGDQVPSLCGLHPHCRCSPATLLPDWGFTPGGMLTYISPGHDELARQRS